MYITKSKTYLHFTSKTITINRKLNSKSSPGGLRYCARAPVTNMFVFILIFMSYHISVLLLKY